MFITDSGRSTRLALPRGPAACDSLDPLPLALPQERVLLAYTIS